MVCGKKRDERDPLKRTVVVKDGSCLYCRDGAASGLSLLRFGRSVCHQLKIINDVSAHALRVKSCFPRVYQRRLMATVQSIGLAGVLQRNRTSPMSFASLYKLASLQKHPERGGLGEAH